MARPQSSVTSYNDTGRDTTDGGANVPPYNYNSSAENYPVLSFNGSSATFTGTGDANGDPDWFVIDTTGGPVDYLGSVATGTPLTFTVQGGGARLELGRREQTWSNLQQMGLNYNSSSFISAGGPMVNTITIGSGEATTFRVYGATGAYTINITRGTTAPTPDQPTQPTQPTPPTQPNRPPVANADTTTLTPGQRMNLNVLGGINSSPDYDLDGDFLNISTVSKPAHGTAELTSDGVGFNRAIVYTPDAGYTGADSFSYTIIDNKGGSASTTVTLNAPRINGNPIANPDPTTTTPARAATINVLQNDSDPNGDTISLTGVSRPQNGTTKINADGRTVVYTPNAGFSGTDSFTYTISDGKGGTAVGTVPVTVKLPVVTVAPAPHEVVEGDITRRTIRFDVVLEEAPLDHAPVTVHYKVEGLNDAAVVGRDFEALEGDLEIPASATTRDVNVVVIGDTRQEQNGQLQLVLSKPVNAMLPSNVVTQPYFGTIIDDDTPIPASDLPAGAQVRQDTAGQVAGTRQTYSSPSYAQASDGTFDTTDGVDLARFGKGWQALDAAIAKDFVRNAVDFLKDAGQRAGLAWVAGVAEKLANPAGKFFKDLYNFDKWVLDQTEALTNDVLNPDPSFEQGRTFDREFESRADGMYESMKDGVDSKSKPTDEQLRQVIGGMQVMSRHSDVSLQQVFDTSLSPAQIVSASGHRDFMVGSHNNDKLAGGDQNDLLYGGRGDDTLTGGTGNDLIIGGEGRDTAVFTGNFASYLLETRASGSNGQITIRDLVAGRDGTDKLIGIETLAFADRTLQVVPDDKPLVDDLYYYSRNPDVLAAGLDADDHYNTYGWKEGRDPNALFSTRGYLAANPDVRAAQLNPLEHYDTYGWKEGRDPSASFDNEQYLARNPDVKAARLDPFAHYLQYGQGEGRQSYAAIGKSADLAVRPGFDAEYYLLSNLDVARAATASGRDPSAFAYEHYQASGWREGRNPNAVFDTKGYLDAYADVRAARIDPLMHYDTYGWKENRDPSKSFDTSRYLAANPDVAQARLDPMLHYLQYGAVEGRPVTADGRFDAPGSL